MIRLGNRFGLLLGLAALAVVPATLAGQSTAQRPTFWGQLAFGVAGITDSGMIHSSVGVSMHCTPSTT